MKDSHSSPKLNLKSIKLFFLSNLDFHFYIERNVITSDTILCFIISLVQWSRQRQKLAQRRNHIHLFLLSWAASFLSFLGWAGMGMLVVLPFMSLVFQNAWEWISEVQLSYIILGFWWPKVILETFSYKNNFSFYFLFFRFNLKKKMASVKRLGRKDLLWVGSYMNTCRKACLLET